jgi:hypothetical protein
VVRAVVSSLPPGAHDERPAEGAWSPREVLAHLLHAETHTFPERLRRLAEQDDLAWFTITSAPDPGEPEQMLADWSTARAANLVWLRPLTPAQRAHATQHPRFGRITLETYVIEWAYHDLDHLRQILSVLAADLYPHIGTFQSLYAPPV